MTNSTNSAISITNTAVDITNFSDIGLSTNTTYFYWVKSYNQSGSLGYSAVISNTTQGITNAPYGNDLKIVYVGPNPFRPNTDANVDHVTFVNLTKNVTITIYTILGKEVFKISKEKIGNSSNYKWNVKNSNGDKLASGVYICHIKNDKGHSKILRLVVIR